MQQSRYDILIAHKINKLSIDYIFQIVYQKEIFSGQTTISYKGIESTVELFIPLVKWHFDFVSNEHLTIVATFSKDESTLTIDGKEIITLEEMHQCSMSFKIDVNLLLNSDTQKNTFFETDGNFEALLGLSELYILAIKKMLKEGFAKAKGNVRNIFFSQEKHISDLLHENVTLTKVFNIPNTQSVENSYICIGQMIDNRIPPEEASFPTDEMAQNPDFIIHLSPYMYLKMGLYDHLTKAYPDTNFEFSEEGKLLCRVGGAEIEMDKKTIADSLATDEENILECKTSYLEFSFTDDYFKVKSVSHVEVFRKLFWLFPDNYEVITTTGRYYQLKLKFKDNDQILGADEKESLKEEKSEVIYKHPVIDQIVDAIKNAVEKLAIIVIEYVLPIGIDLIFGLNPITGAILFSVCNSLGDYLDSEWHRKEMNEKINFINKVNNIEISFKDKMPFKIEGFKIIDFKINEGALFIAAL